MIFTIKPPHRHSLPIFAAGVAAGFPSPADDHIDGALDLNLHLIKHPAATFIVRAAGTSMIGAGIHNGDLLIVDRSLDPRDGAIVIAAVNGELTVKRLRAVKDGFVLKAENQDFPDIPIDRHMECAIWGVVAFAVHQLWPPA